MSFNKNHQYKASGFLLLEVVIAIALLAVMMTIGYGTASQLLHTGKTLNDERAIQNEAEIIVTRIGRELSLAYDSGQPLLPPCEQQNTTTGKNTFFRGQSNLLDNGQSSDSITFLAPGVGQFLPDSSSQRGIVQVQYRLLPDPDRPGKLAFVREETPLVRPISRACQRSLRFHISKRVEGLSFMYQDPSTKEWKRQWGENSSRPLPSVVRIEVRLRTIEGFLRTYVVAVGLRATR